MVSDDGAGRGAARCSRARTARRAGRRASARGSVHCSHAVPPAPGDDRDTAVETARRRPAAAWRYSRHSCRARVGRRRPLGQQLGQIAADAGRTPASSRASTAISSPRLAGGRTHRRVARRRGARVPGVARRLAPGPRAAPPRAASRRAGAPSRAANAVHVVRVRSGDAASPATSGSEPRFETTTGTPHAIASSTGSPNPSSNDGRTSMRACAIQLAACAGRRHSRELDVARERRRRARSMPARRPDRVTPPGDHQRRRVGPPRRASARRRRAARRCSCAAPACRGTGCARAGAAPARCRATSGAQAGAPGEQTVIARPRDAQLRDDFAGGVVRRHDNVIGARARARAPGPESRGASRPRVRSGCGRKSQVVNRDDLRRRARRESAAASGEWTTSTGAGQPFDRRPAEPIPGPGRAPRTGMRRSTIATPAVRRRARGRADPSRRW